jgi:hypothetical protein
MAKRNYTLEELEERIKESALEIAPDYPGIADCNAWEQSWAIQNSYKGLDQANTGNLTMIFLFSKKLGLTEEQIITLSHALYKKEGNDWSKRPPEGQLISEMLTEWDSILGIKTLS